MKRKERKIVQDIRQYKWLILALIAMVVIMNLLFHTTCPGVLLLGLPCPGCGITRALWLLCTGHPVQAFLMNPSVYVWLAFGCYVVFYRYILEKKVPHLTAVLVMVIAAVFLIYGVGMWKYFPFREPYTVKTDNVLGQIWPEYSAFLQSF